MSKKSKRIKSKKAFKVKLKPGVIYSITEIVFFLLAFLVIISFSRQGLALRYVNDILISLFLGLLFFCLLFLLFLVFLFQNLKLLFLSRM